MRKIIFAGVLVAGVIAATLATARAQDAMGGLAPSQPSISFSLQKSADRRTVRALREVAAASRRIVSVPRPQPVSGYGRMVTASWYGGGEKLSPRTANGERFRAGGLTAAHKTLPFGTHVRVTNPRTGISAVVRINDRGPFIAGRSIDLARGAAQAIGLHSTQAVRMEVL